MTFYGEGGGGAAADECSMIAVEFRLDESERSYPIMNHGWMDVWVEASN